MQEPRSSNPRNPSSGRGRDTSQAVRPAAAAAGRQRVLLLGVLAAAAMAVALVSNQGRVATENPARARPAAPTASAAFQALGAPESRAPVATPTPPPTATPSPYRPLVTPIMPPVRASGGTPARKPGAPDPDPSASHVIVVDGDSGAVLFQRNAHDPIAPASLTKVMTALLGIERGDLAEHVKTDVDASTLTDSTVMGLMPWFDVTLEDLLYGLMLPSGNDAALAIARYVGGSDEAFVRLMNERAAELGLRCTRFANPHGLDEPGHRSCPADMVALSRYAMQNPTFRKLAAARTYDIRESNISYTLWNLNPVLGAYQGADGVKIGYTDDAGRSIVATAVRNGHRVYVAFMRSKDGLVPDTKLLLDWAFNSHTWP